jgi:hypothetical protein
MAFPFVPGCLGAFFAGPQTTRKGYAGIGGRHKPVENWRNAAPAQ